MHQQITVIGPIASGKTTASQILAEKLGLPLLDADLYETNPFLPDYIANTPRWAFTTELFFTLARIKKLKAIKSMLQKSSVIVDSGLIMSHQVYTKNHLVMGTMTAGEWEFFTRIISDYQSDLPSPDIVIHLTCSPTTQLARIQARGRSFESGYTLEYLQSITDRLSEYAESISGNKFTSLCTSSLHRRHEKCIQTRSSLGYLTFDSQKYDLTKLSGQKELLSLLQIHLS